MPTYKVTSPTGQSISITGDTPPNETQLNQIFQQAGSKSSQIQNTSQPALKGVGDLLTSLGLGAIKNIGADAYDIGNFALHGQGGFNNGYNNPLRSEQQLSQTRNPQDLGGAALQEGKDVAGLASWAVPGSLATKAPVVGGLLSKAPGIVSAGANLATQGGIQGGLNAVSQDNATPQSVVGGAESGAIANPLLAGLGNLLTDKLPRYIGIRNYGTAGAKLPEVVKAENAAGGQTLKEVRNAVLENATGASEDKSILMNNLKDLAAQPEWVGTPGLQDFKRKVGKALITETGALADLSKAQEKSTDMFDFYNRVKNMAYPDSNSPASNRLASFMRSAAQTVREHLIKTSTNPDITRSAMDVYAAQTAMKAAKGGIGGNKVTNAISSIAKSGGEAGIAALLSAIPALHGLTLPVLADTLLTNSVTGPATARGLVNLGQKTSKNIGGTSISNILRKIGVSGIQGLTNLGGPQ